MPYEILKIQNSIWEHIGALNKFYRTNYVFNFTETGVKENKTEYDWFKYFIDNNILFSKIPIGPIISSSIITNNIDTIKYEKFK